LILQADLRQINTIKLKNKKLNSNGNIQCGYLIPSLMIKKQNKGGGGGGGKKRGKKTK